MFNKNSAVFRNGYCWTQYYERYKNEIKDDKILEENFQKYIKNNLVISDKDNKDFYDSLSQHRYGNSVLPNQLDIILLGKFCESTAFTNIKDRTFINHLLTMPVIAEKIRLVKNIMFTRYSIEYHPHFLIHPEQNENMTLKIEIADKDYMETKGLNLLEKVKIMLEDKESPIFICVPVDHVMQEFLDNFIEQLDKKYRNKEN